MFEIYQDKETKLFHFRLKAANGQVILTGPAYEDKTSCAHGVFAVLKNGRQESLYEVMESESGKQYFVLRSVTGQIIGQSQEYSSESGLKNGIISVGNNVANPRVRDLAA